MHYGLMVIKPVEIELEDLMWKFAEVDKSQTQRMDDKRCIFINDIPESEVPGILEKIQEYYSKKQKECQEQLVYRASHTLEESGNKYDIDYYFEGIYNMNITSYNVLQEYERVKNMALDNPELIHFIKEYGYVVKKDDYGHYIFPEIYIKGVGYGHFDNPYGIMDYYIIMEDTSLKTINGDDVNNVLLNQLDVEGTLGKLNKDDYYPYIIFCENEVEDARLFNKGHDYHFNEHNGNAECLVESTHDVLRDLYSKYKDDNQYEVMVLDIHS